MFFLEDLKFLTKTPPWATSTKFKMDFDKFNRSEFKMDFDKFNRDRTTPRHKARSLVRIVFVPFSRFITASFGRTSVTNKNLDARRHLSLS